MFGKYPDYNALRSFGCACYPLLSPYGFAPKDASFLDIAQISMVTGAQIHFSKRVFICRHVVFNEHTFSTKEKLSFFASSMVFPPTVTFPFIASFDSSSSFLPFLLLILQLSPSFPLHLCCLILVVFFMSPTLLPLSYLQILLPHP